MFYILLPNLLYFAVSLIKVCFFKFLLQNCITFFKVQNLLSPCLNYFKFFLTSIFFITDSFYYFLCVFGGYMFDLRRCNASYFQIFIKHAAYKLFRKDLGGLD